MGLGIKVSSPKHIQHTSQGYMWSLDISMRFRYNAVNFPKIITEVTPKLARSGQEGGVMYEFIVWLWFSCWYFNVSCNVMLYYTAL